MTTRNTAADYAKLQDLLPSVAPGTLTQRIREAFGFSDASSARKMVLRLRQAGYDMTAYDAAAAAKYQAPAMLEAIAKARNCRKAVVLSAARAKSTAPPRPAQKGQRTTAVESAAAWERDMRLVANEPGAVNTLCVLWDVHRTAAYSRIAAVRETGIDMSWWQPAPSRAFRPDPPKPPQPVEIPRLFQALAPGANPAVPWSLVGISNALDVPVSRVCERAERMGIAAHQGAAMVDAREARLIMWTFGFVPCERAA
jgi:hypothetical protein